MTEKDSLIKKERPEPEKLTKLVSFRLTEADHSIYQAKVERSGMRTSAFFRECVLTNKTKVIARQKSSIEKNKLVFLFNKTSNNLNQLAHRANEENKKGIISEATYTRIISALKNLSREMKDIISYAD